MKKLLKNKMIRDVPGSFRDPSGFMFYRDGSFFRQINHVYKDNYDRLMNTGLYQSLVKENLLICHEEMDASYRETEKAYKIIKPIQIPFISYPYEWSFSQLKDAALATLKIQKQALDYGISLKDASAFNIQFLEGKPVFIDTLSFEKYKIGEPWVAYKQFCQHFLAPLSLMSFKDIRLSQLLRVFIDGLPLDLASSLLPWRTYLKYNLSLHIHLHAKSQNYYSNKTITSTKKPTISRNSFLGLIDSLETTIKNLKWQPKGTEWGDYYSDTNYSSSDFQRKKEIVDEFLNRANPEIVWDLGANTGVFSRVSSKQGKLTISFDIDPAAVEKNYLEAQKNNEEDILPLVLDLSNPSSGIGWNHTERMSLVCRAPADTVQALALIHHLAISNNLPLKKIASFFFDISNSLIIEFVPKTDSQVQRLLATREDIFVDYTQEAFESEFKAYFRIVDSKKISESERTIYFMEKRQ